MAVLIQTSLGDITIDLCVDEVPLLCCNFLKLCKYKYYNNSLFHSVEKDFIARTGLKYNATDNDESIFMIIKKNDSNAYSDILKNKKNISSIYSHCGEYINESTGYLYEQFHPNLKFKTKGTVAMANDIVNSIGSSFFITLRDNINYLDNRRSIIGYVSEGLDILDAINNAYFDDIISTKPLQNIRILHAIILADPFPDPPGHLFINEIPSPREIVDAYEKIEENGVVEDEIAVMEKIAKSEAKSRAVALEILGDIPDAEIAPPENVLFICKLNPITEAEDLKLIFSRFGKILSCEIIRDWKTGDSLQYAFIEYDNVKSCEAALFKMEGCLIDDRRIHVDFCQSISKQWFDYRRYGVYQNKNNKNRQHSTLYDNANINENFVFKDNSPQGNKKKSSYEAKHLKNKKYSSPETSTRSYSKRKVSEVYSGSRSGYKENVSSTKHHNGNTDRKYSNRKYSNDYDDKYSRKDHRKYDHSNELRHSRYSNKERKEI